MSTIPPSRQDMLPIFLCKGSFFILTNKPLLWYFAQFKIIVIKKLKYSAEKMPWSHSGWGRIDISDALGRPYPPLQSTPIYSDNNILQMVVWESFFFNQGIACLEIAQLWVVLVKYWLSNDCGFDSFSTSQIGWNGVAVTVQSHRRYGAIAMPLRCNRDAVTV